MATQYLPLIRKEDFEAFKRLLGANLPDAYDGWRQLVTDRADMILKSQHHVVMKEVDPNQFAAWIKATGRQTTLNALDTFTFQQATRVERD